MRTVTFIGVGRLGGALATALSKSGFSVRQLVRRNRDITAIANQIDPAPVVLNSTDPSALDSDIVFITTGDGEIGQTVKLIADRLDPSAILIHASGALSSDILKAAHRRGNPVGSLHPLVSVSDPLAGSGVFRDAYFCIEGDRAAVTAAEEIVRALGGRSFTIDRHLKPLYHASAVMAAGHVTALFSMATEMLAACGLSPDEAAKILLPLLQSTVQNLAKLSPEKALTGPFARADRETIELHLNALNKSGLNDILEVYLALGKRSIELAENAGADPSDLEPIREYIKLAKGSDR